MDASTEDDKKPFHQFLKAKALGNVYTTTSLFYQWKYLSALSEQQLIYSKCVLKSLKRLEKSQKQNNYKFGFFKRRVEAESDSVDSDVESDAKKPVQPSETQSQSPVAQNDNAGAPVNLQSSPIRTPINQPAEAASQTSRSSQTDFPFALYIKLLAFLIIIKAHRLLMYSYTFIVTCHFLGVFNPIINRIKAYFHELGFNDTQQLHLVLRKLKARQQMQAQQVQSEIVAMQILQDLRQFTNQNSAELPTNPIVGTVCTESCISASEIANGVVFASAEAEQAKEMNCDDILIQDENDSETNRSAATQQNLISQSKAATEIPPKQFNKKLYIMQFIYQLFFAFIFSLNPRWEPICMLVYDDYKPDNSESQQ